MSEDVSVRPDTSLKPCPFCDEFLHVEPEGRHYLIHPASGCFMSKRTVGWNEAAAWDARVLINDRVGMK